MIQNIQKTIDSHDKKTFPLSNKAATLSMRATFVTVTAYITCANNISAPNYSNTVLT